MLRTEAHPCGGGAIQTRRRLAASAARPVLNKNQVPGSVTGVEFVKPMSCIMTPKFTGEAAECHSTLNPAKPGEISWSVEVTSMKFCRWSTALRRARQLSSRVAILSQHRVYYPPMFRVMFVRLGERWDPRSGRFEVDTWEGAW